MWELIRANRRKSLVLFFIMGMFLVLLGYLIGQAFKPQGGGITGVVIAIFVWFILNMISMFSGSKIMLTVSNAKEITPDVHPRLYNIVEEMRMAANLPKTPKVYIINTEAPNAFATGRTPDDAAIAVTAGLLAKLNRDELQGVVAHETSHILNRDIRFMTYAGIMLGTIVLISELYLRTLFFSSSARYRSDSKGGGQGQLIMMVLAIVMAILAPIAAQLLYFAISRKREYLADASAVRLTRYPEGLAAALEKISGSTQDIETANKVTAPMYIVNPLKKKGMKIADLTSTHPPISERIRILRSMAGGANFTSYQQAWSTVTGSPSHIIPRSGLADNESLGFRPPASGEDIEADMKQSRRDLGNLMMAVNQYTFIDCPCGVKLKVPPDYKSLQVECPRCGRIHKVSD
ncbi:MAG: M48 family metallopeptidase [Bacteroidetes bacterium]|nr:M48 family metallopeptidase [Bacteroidota bacterium]